MSQRSRNLSGLAKAQHRPTVWPNMSLWLRAGPVRVSSRGRMGVRLGPVSVYGGGRRRSRSGSGGTLLGLLVVLALIGLAIEYWFITIPIAAVVVAVAIAVTRNTRRRALERHHAWLNGPPPPLIFPGRFTPNWFARNGSHLHPGQVPVLLAELRRRGWSEADIEQRAAPFLPL